MTLGENPRKVIILKLTLLLLFFSYKMNEYLSIIHQKLNSIMFNEPECTSYLAKLLYHFPCPWIFLVIADILPIIIFSTKKTK